MLKYCITSNNTRFCEVGTYDMRMLKLVHAYHAGWLFVHLIDITTKRRINVKCWLELCNMLGKCVFSFLGPKGWLRVTSVATLIKFVVMYCCYLRSFGSAPWVWAAVNACWVRSIHLHTCRATVQLNPDRQLYYIL